MMRERIISPLTLSALFEVVEVGIVGEGALEVPIRFLSGNSIALTSLLYLGTSEPPSLFLLLPAVEPASRVSFYIF